MFFRKKPKSDLEEVIKHIQKANDIMLSYKRNKTFTPSDKDLENFSIIQHKLHESYGLAGYIHISMLQRISGEEEGATKFKTEQTSKSYSSH